jgi:LysR family glycine cleavage system transcriptional activator
LAAGRLILPFELSLPSDFSYFIVCDPAQSNRPAIKAFCDWLLEEARITAAQPALACS